MSLRKFTLVTLLVMVAVGVFSLPIANAQPTLKDTVTNIINSIYATGDISVIDTQFAPTFVRHPAETDINALKISALSLRAAMPDLTAATEIVLVEGSFAAARVRLTGTFTGEFVSPNALPIAPNGKVIEFAVHLLYRFDEAGKIAEEWDGFDNLNFLGQLGVLPSLGFTPVAPMQYPAVVDVGMSPQNKQLVQGYFDAFNQANWGYIDTAFKADFAAHNPFGTLDRAGMSADLQRLRGALPDLTETVTQVVTEGNWTAALYTIKGTFTGQYVNADGSSIPPTGQPLDLPAITFFRFDEQGLVAESFEVYDSLSFLTQLGLITVTAPILEITPTPGA
ncbi:MAG: ester cyclase [Chloroflexi bacterium]|nr:ester cyclase [Chloroflexota bacterium]MCC6895583.1 ester cyclase [Anaerolineae bacterium]